MELSTDHRLMMSPQPQLRVCPSRVIAVITITHRDGYKCQPESL